MAQLSMGFKDYYSTLNISQAASSDEIKRAFRDKAKKYHPDVCTLPNAHQLFIDVGEAYEVLKDPALRNEYDTLYNEVIHKYESSNGRSSFTDTNNSNVESRYSNFYSSQQKARSTAESYSKMSLFDLMNGLLGFGYELGRAVIVGERNKPEISTGDFIAMGFKGLLLTICIIISLTGIGAIPGILIAKGVLDGISKKGKLVGIGPFLLSTLIIDTIVLIMIYSIITSLI